MQGIGDQIYSRPFVRLLARDNEVYIKTVLPSLYSDIPGLKFLDPGVPLYRTQAKAFASQEVDFVKPVRFQRKVNWHYGRLELKKHGIIPHMMECFGFDMGTELKFNLPTWEAAEQLLDNTIYTAKKIAVVRPATVRSEWKCSSRNANPDYIAWCARMLQDAGYYVISIADCVDGVEWIDGEEPPADLKLHKGELGLLGTLSLLKRAHIVVGGSGFIIPGTVSAQTNLFVIFGGRGEYDNPHKVFDLRMNMKKIGWAIPENFCRCNRMEHDCDKTIKNLDDQFFRFMGTI
jgi:hypothetical protein